jgi:hypothetical protein
MVFTQIRFEAFFCVCDGALITHLSSCAIHKNNQTKVSFLECLIRLDKKGLVFEIFLLVILGGSYTPVVLIHR